MNDIISQSKSELEKKAEKIKQVRYGRVIIEIKHNNVSLLRVIEEFTPTREQ